MAKQRWPKRWHLSWYPLIVVRYETLVGSYLGETSPTESVLIIKDAALRFVFDEFETLGKNVATIMKRGDKRVVSTLLLQLDEMPD
jgi:hypothetical protein